MSASTAPAPFPRAAATLAALAALLVPAQAQAASPLQAESAARPSAPSADPALALAPGQLPPDASESARARYAKLLGALGGRPLLRSFTLRFDVETRSEAGTQEARRTELSYLDEGPGWVYGATLNPDGSVKQSQMRGPQDDGRRGYWQVLKSGDVQRLVGPDFAEARAQLDGWAALCHDLLLLQQPDRLRLVRLAARDAAPVGTAGSDTRALDFGNGDVVVLPDALLDQNDRGRSRTPLAARARQLEWLEVVTPDIRLWREEGEPGALRRVLLGVHPDVGVPELALLTQSVDGRLVAPDATLLHLADWRPFPPSGARQPGAEGAATRLLPRSTRLFELRAAEGDERRHGPLAFRDRATVDLFLLEGGRLDSEPLPVSRFKPR